jgi:hypothetical protein
MRWSGAELACGLVFLIACGLGVRGGGRPDPQPEPLLVLTGNELGFIRPCGCSKPALGGIHRRARALAELRGGREIGAVSLGNLVIEGGRQQRLKFEAFLMALAAMGYDALVPGPGEFRLGVDYLVDEASRLVDVPFVLANAFRGEERLFKRSLPLPRIGAVLVGLVPEMPEVHGVRVAAPADTLRDLVLELPPGSLLLVAWMGEESGLTALAEAIPEPRRERVLFLIGGTSDIPRALGSASGVAAFSVGSKGRDLAWLLAGESGLRIQSRRLAETIEPDPDVAAILEAYRSSVKDEEILKSWPRAEAASVYVGNASCQECHSGIVEQLADSAHMRAYATLVATGDQYDPECIACHVVGFGDRSGFVDFATTPELVNVACEACHGPGEAHAMSQAPTPVGKVGSRHCVRCHDPDNSPQFRFETYWPKIAHPRDGGTGR